MAWLGVNLNDSINSIKGQITSFTKEVLNDDGIEDSDVDVFISKKRLKKLEDELLLSKQEINDLRNESSQLKQNLHESDIGGTHRISLLKQQLTEAQVELYELKEKSTEWGWDNGVQDSSIVSASQNVERICFLEKHLQEERQKHEDELFALKETHRLQNTLANTDLQLNTSNEKLSSAALDDKTNEIERLQKQISSLNSVVECLTEEKSRLSTNLEELDNEHLKIIDQIILSKKQLTDEVKHHKEQIEQLNQCKHQYEAQISGLEARILHSLEESTETALKWQQQLCNREKAYEELKETLDKETDRMNRELEKVIMQMTQKVKLVDQLRDKLESQHEDILKYEAVIEEKNSEHLDTYNRMRRMQETNVTFAAQGEALNVQISDLNKELQDKETARKKLLDNCHVQNSKELETTVAEMVSEVASLRCERDKFSDTVMKCAQEQRVSQDLLEAMESDKAEIERECEDLRDQLEELQRGERIPPEGGSLPTIQEEEDDDRKEELEDVIKQEENYKTDNKEEPDKNEKILQKQVNVLSEARHDLGLELANVKREKTDLDQKLHHLTRQMGNLAKLELEAATLRTKNELLTEREIDFRNQAETFAKVQIENVRLNDQVLLLTQALDNVNTNADSIHVEELHHLHSQLSCKNEQLARKDKQIHEYYHELSRLSDKDPACNQIESMRTEVDKLKGLMVYKDDQIDELRQGLEQIGQIYGASKYDLRTVYITAKQSFEAMSIDIKETKILLQEVRVQLQEPDNDALNKLVELEQVTEKVRLTEEKLLQKSRDFEKQHVDIDQGLEKIKYLETEVVQLERNSSDFSTKLDYKVNELEALKIELSQSKSELEVKETKLDRTMKRLDQNELLLENQKEKLMSLEDNIETRYAEHDALTNQSNNVEMELRAEINTLKVDCSSHVVELESLKNSTKNYEHTQNKETEAKLNDLNQHVIALKSQENEITKELNAAKFNASELQKERDRLVVMSTQKHQESLSYYTEIQRLTQLMQADKEIHTAALISSNKDVMNKTEIIQQNREEIMTLTKKLTRSASEDSSARNQMKLVQEELRRTNDEMMKQQELLRSIVGERDQLRSTNASFNRQLEEFLLVQESLTHVSQECSRLKQHLIEMEETTTQETLQSEQREASLKLTLAKLHEKMASHSELYSNTKEKSSAKLDRAEEELRAITVVRDDLLQRLQIAEENCLQYQESLSRLQQVLHDFQKDQVRDIANATERETRKYLEEKERSNKLEIDAKKTQVKCLDLESALSATTNIREDVHAKEDTIIALKSQVHSIQLAAKKSQEQVATLQTFSDSKIDKPLIRNLLVGYFATPSDKRGEVLRVLAQVLDFSAEERDRTGLDLRGTSWLSSIANFLAPPPSNVIVTSKVDQLDHSSLSQAFIRFLEDESTPRLQPKLPAVQMAQEAHQKAQKKAIKGTSTLLMQPPVPSSIIQPVAPKETNSLVEPLEQPKFLSNLLNVSSDQTETQQENSS